VGGLCYHAAKIYFDEIFLMNFSNEFLRLDKKAFFKIEILQRKRGRKRRRRIKKQNGNIRFMPSRAVCAPRLPIGNER